MSYKTYVNDTQIFGNNESYPEWINYIKSKGIEVGENDSYTGELDNFMEALDVIESIVMKLEAERHENKKNGLSFDGKHTRIYKLKDGCKIKVTAG